MSSFSSFFDGKGSLTNSQRCLVELVSRIQIKRKGKHEPEMHEVHVFVSQLLSLANEYKAQGELVTAKKIAREKFAGIVEASKGLQEALRECGGLELELLKEARLKVLSLYTLTEDDDVSSGYEFDGPSYGQRELWLIDADLRWLRSAAESLSPKRTRGGQIDVAERHVAQKFVVHCHEHCWSPLKVANSQTETKKSQTNGSDATECLKAIFVAGGESPTRAESSAKSALKALRKEFVYANPEVCDFYGRMIMEEEFSFVNLNGSLRESDKILRDLPRFGPPE